MKLPRNIKESILFLLIVSIISVNLITPTVIMCERGFSWHNYQSILAALPFIWPAIVISILIAKKPASYFQKKITDKDDSFNSQIIINTICSVIIISAIMTIAGSWISQRTVPLHTIRQFGQIWPRNFGIALAVQVLIAQPIARQVMVFIH